MGDWVSCARTMERYLPLCMGSVCRSADQACRVVRGVVCRVVRGAGQWVVRGSGVSLFYFTVLGNLTKSFTFEARASDIRRTNRQTVDLS